MKLLVIVLCVCVLAPAAWAKLLVGETYYRDTNASLHVFVTNTGAEPVSVLAPVVNGFDAATLGRDGLTAGSVIWYRCRPNPVPPGGIADVVVTLAEPTDKPATVELRTASGEHVKATIECKAEALRFQAIRFSRDLRSVDIYARWSDASSADALTKIKVDGGRIDGHASPWPAQSLDGLAYTRISLDKPLARGSFHVFEVGTESGLTTAYQIRAIPAEFLIGVYGSPSDQNILDWAAHGCNHYLSFGAVKPELIEGMSAKGISVGAKYIPQPLVDRTKGAVVVCDNDAARGILQGFVGESGLLYHHLVDEPDAADYFAGKRLGASAMELIARGDLCAACDPERYTFVQLDNTFRPRNYRVYGEAADVLATHRYSLGSVIRGEAGSTTATSLAFLGDLQETLSRFRGATEPSPFFMVTQFFDLGAGRLGRAPTIEEMRLQCYVMIAGGARGLIHYIHSGSGGGHEGAKTPALWDAMTAMHEELKRVGEITDMGTPAPESWVKTGSANVRASAVLCGDRLAIVAVNLAHRSAPEQFTARVTRDVTISVHVPPWIRASALQVTPADGGASIPVAVNGEELSFTVDQIKDARGFLLTPRAR